MDRDHAPSNVPPLERIIRLVRWTFTSLAGLSMFVIFGSVFANSFSRYFLNSSLLWGVEAATYGMIFGTVFGMLAAYTSDRNVRFMILVDLLGEPISRYFSLASHLIAILLGTALTSSAWDFIARRGDVTSPGLGIEMKYPQAAMLIAGAGLVLVAALKVFEVIDAMRRPRGTT